METWPPERTGQLIADAKQRRFQAVLVWALDRLSREGAPAILSLVHKLSIYGVKVLSYQESWTEAPGELAELLYALSGWVARMESQRRSGKTKAGLDRVRVQGKRLGRPPRSKDRRKRKRRQYSWQQAESIITEEELRTAYKQIQSEESIIEEQLERLENFKREPAPPDMATFKQLAEYFICEITSDLYDAPDDMKVRFAELFDLYMTIRSDSSQNGYHVDLSANIPLEMEGDKPSTYDIVLSPSRGRLRERD